jgi:plastocyanin
VRVRGRYLPLAAIVGGVVGLAPAVASSETSPTIEAVNAGLYSHSWSPTQASVGVGGAVAIRNPTAVAHGVEWIGPLKPECSSGVPVGTTPAASGKEWSGTCTFAQAGTYTFYCTVHGPEMTGTITVSASGTTTTTTTTTTPPATTPTTPGSTPPGESPSAAASLLSGPSFALREHGGVVRGSLAISSAGVGDRLEVDVFARGVSLGKARRAGRVRVGRLARGAVSAGTLAFLVRLDAQARRALKRHRRLGLVVRVTLTPPSGSPTSVTRTVVEHA